MKRRRALQSILSLPAAAALPLPGQTQSAGPAEEHPKTPTTAPDVVAGAVARFFAPEEFAALRKLAELIAPAGPNSPGAIEAGAPEFLDFLLGSSPPDRATLYREGLQRLNAEARRRYQKPFADTTPVEAGPIVAPLEEAWTYDGPADRFARFLQAAKDDILGATFNSREYAEAMSRRSRRAG